MKRYSHLKEKARKFRQTGMSLNDIVDRLKMPKTTIFYWIKNIELKKIPLNVRKGNNANRIKHAKIRKDIYDETFSNASVLLQDMNLRDFVILYMCEGYRKNRNQVAICNSSVAIMKLCNKIMKKMAKNKISYVVRIHKDQSELEVKTFWSDQLGIDKNIIKTVYKKNSSSLRQRNWRCTNGVLTILSSDTKLRTQISALSDVIQSEW